MRVGFIGLGNMGLGMARNVAKAGFSTIVYDVRAEPTDLLRSDGAEVAATCAEAAKNADVVSVAVFDGPQLRATILGSDSDGGVLSTAPKGCVIAIHSTVSPTIVKELADAAAEHGVHVMDVAMSGGGPVAADAGTLTFMVGGDQDSFKTFQPVLSAMATTIHHMGQLGAGMAAKIVNNFLVDGNITLVREAVRLAAGSGIAEDRILEVVTDNKVASSFVSTNWNHFRELEESSWNGAQNLVDMYHKDLQLAFDLASENGVNAPTLDFIVREVSPTVGAGGVTR